MMKWQKVQQVSADPYGHWALTAGRDSLVTYRDTPELSRRPFMIVFDRDDFEEKKLAEVLSIQRFESAFDGPEAFGGHIDLDKRPDPDKIVFPAPLVPEAATSQPRPPVWQKPALFVPEDFKVIGVIDDAIDVAHDAFVGDSGTRVDFAWIQEGAARKGGKKAAPFGFELLKEDIDKARRLSAETTDPLVALGLAGPEFDHYNILKRTTHGTSIADLATGGRPGALRDFHRLVAVQLPAGANWDNSGATLGFFVAWGINFILERAKLISKVLYEGTEDPDRRVPVLINLSIGPSNGSRDGESYIERLIEAQLRRYRTVKGKSKKEFSAVLVMASGNGFLRRRHARKKAKKKKTEALGLEWRLGPGDRTSSYLEIYVPKKAKDVKITIEPPNVKSRSWRPHDLSDEASPQIKVLAERGGTHDAIAQVSYDRPVSASKNRILVIVGPTDTSALEKKRTAAACGVWKVRVSAKIKKGERIEAWVQREEMPFGYPERGGTAFIDDEKYKVFDERGDWIQDDKDGSVVRRFGSLSGAVSGASTIAVGANHDHDGQASLYSAAAARKGKDGVQAAAVGDSSRSLRGILTASTRSGTNSVPFSGTSVAVPQVVRQLSDTLTSKKGKNVGQKAVRKLARDGEGLRKKRKNWSTGGSQGKIDKRRAGDGRVEVSADQKDRVIRGREL